MFAFVKTITLGLNKLELISGVMRVPSGRDGSQAFLMFAQFLLIFANLIWMPSVGKWLIAEISFFLCRARLSLLFWREWPPFTYSIIDGKKLIKNKRMRKHKWTMLDVHIHTSLSSSIETESHMIRREGREIYSS